MTVQAKISPSEQSLTSMPEQAVGQSIPVPPGNNIALNIPENAVESYSREGTDLVVHLKTGEVVHITGFYADPQTLSHLYLIEDDKLVSAQLAPAASDGSVAVSYGAETADAGFSASGAAAEAAGTGTAGAGAAGGAVAGSSWLGTAALAAGGVAAAGGATAAVSSGGGHDSSSPAKTATAAPPPAAAADLTFAAQGTTLSGTGEAGATVFVDINGDGRPDATATVGSDGRFTVALSQPVIDGQTVTVWLTDPAGGQSAAITVTVSGMTAPPFPVLDASNGLVLAGTAEAGSVVTLTDAAGALLGRVTAGVDGHWSFTLLSRLANGAVVHATATDAAGNVSQLATLTIDAAPPAIPVIQPSSGTALVGTAEAGSTVTLTDAAGNLIGQVTAGADGHWSLTPATALADGTVVHATATDAAGNVSAAVSITIALPAPPPVPTIDPSNGTVLHGTAEAGATITLSDGSGDVIGQTVADGTGHWSFTPAAALADGTIVHAAAGNADGTSLQASAIVDAAAPTAPILYPSTGASLSGTAEAGSTVTLTDATGHQIGQAVADTTGHWSFTPAVPLSIGSLVLATATDAAGNVSSEGTLTITTTAAPPIPVIDSVDMSNATTVGGTATPGAVITLTGAGNTVLGTATADGTGHWTIHGAFTNGEVLQVAISSDGGTGTPVSVTIDTVAPAAALVTPSNGLALTGTAEAGSTVTITDSSGHVLGQVTVAANGNWVFAPAMAFADGTVLHVTVTDAAGNASPPASTVVDTLLPPAPVLQASNGTALSGTGEVGDVIVLTTGNGISLGQVSVAANGTWSFTPGAPLANGTVVVATAENGSHIGPPATITIDAVAPAAPTIALSNGTVVSGTAEAGSIVTVTNGGGTVLGHAVTDTTGHWSLTLVSRLANGAVVHVIATDAAGNTSGQGNTTVDASAPAAPSVGASNGAVLSGTAEAGATITLMDAGGTVIGQTIADVTSHWTFSPPVRLDNGTVVRALATDAAGNVSQAGATVVDAAAPAAPVLHASAGTTVSGTAEAGDTVTLTDANGNAIGQTSAGANGNWSVGSLSLADGAVVHATVTDAAGNVSQQGTTTIDATPPAAPVIATTNGSVLVGTAEPGSTVTVTQGGTPVGQTVADVNGNWAVTPGGPLATGTAVSATATDAAGNISPAGTVTVNGALPSIPTIDPSNGATLSGHADPGDTVMLTNGSGNAIGNAVANGVTGVWSFTPGAPLADGTVVHAVASNGGPYSAAASAVIDAAPPVAPLVAPSGGATLSGTAEAGATITLTDGNGAVIGQTTAGANGSWSVTPSGSPLADGAVVYVTATDAAGNASPQSTIAIDSLPPAAPISAPSNGTILSGTAEAGAVITLTDGGGSVIGHATAAANGAWSAVLAAPLANGAVVHATATDAAGNISLANTITIDALDPAVPVIAASNGTVITGTAEAGATVTITLNAVNGTVLGHVITGVDGHWSFTPLSPLADGTVVNATVTDVAGNISLTGSTIVDATPPAAPTLALSNGTTLSGTAEAGSTVVLTDGAGHAIGSTTAGATGTWAYLPGSPLADGTVVHATAIDAAGNVSLPGLVTVDAVAPSAPAVQLRTATLVTGTGEADSIVTLTDGSGNPIGQATVGVAGTWSFTPAAPLADGTAVHVTATDAAGNVSLQSIAIIDALAPPVPVVAPSNGTALIGTAEAGSTVTLTDAGGAVIGQAIADSGGHWSFTLGTPLAGGSVVHATATDAAGNVSPPAATVTIDTVAPAAPVTAASNGTVLTGTAEAGAVITLTDGAGNPIGQVTADSGGHWAFTPAAPLANAAVVHATATDAAGNVSIQGTLTIDALAPSAPTIAPSNGTALGGSAEPNSTITLTDDSGAVIGQAVTDSGGHWSFTPGTPMAGGSVVHATATDAAGNVSPPAATTIDALAPAVPVVAPSNGTALIGTTEPGSTVTLTDAGGTVIGQVAADSGGHWSFTPGSPLANATVVHVTATDAAGNASAQATVTIDTVAPAAPVPAASNGTVLTGTTEAGAVITLTDGAGNPIGQVTADSGGHWAFMPAAPLANAAVVHATATDAAGNVSIQGTLTIDALAPSAPTIAPSNGTALGGSAEPNSTITLTDDSGAVIGQAVTDSGGHWSFTPGTPMAGGSVVHATATDAAGNVSPPAATTIDALAPAVPVVAPSNGTALIGTAEAGSTVTLTDAGGTMIGHATADSGGHWSFAPVAPLADSALVHVTATDAAGNVSAQATVTIDAVPPAAPIFQPSSGSVLSGIAEAGSIVALTAGGTPLGQAIADSHGYWQLTLATPLANGVTVQGTATDAAGNTGLAGSLTVNAALPSTPTITPSGGTFVSGTADPFDTVTLIFSDGTPPTQINVGAGGTWFFTPGSTFADGTVIQVSATDGINTSGTASITVDGIAPAPPVVAPSDGVTLAGTAEAGATITLIDGGGSVVGQTTAAANGTWSLTPGSPLANATVVHVFATDAAGNVSIQSTLTIDAIAPAAPAIAPSNGTILSGAGEIGATIVLSDAAGTVLGQTVVDGSGHWSVTPVSPLANATVIHATATDAAGNVSLQDTATIDAVAPAAPVVAPSNGFTVAGTAEAGSTITLTDGGGNPIGQATTLVNGTWSFTPGARLPDGTVVHATATDAAGNVSQQGVGPVDAVAPLPPVLAPSNGVTLAGTAEAGATVTLTDGSGNPIGQASVAANGTWSFTPASPLANATAVHATATDAVGNVSAPSNIMAVDALAPLAPAIAPSNGTVLSGTGEIGATITLTDAGGTVLGQAVVDGAGHWSLTPVSPLANAAVVHATATDAAGNVSPQGTGTIDAVAPAAPVVTPSNGVTVAGTAETGTTITLTDGGGNPIGQAVTAINGTWSFTPGARLPDGTVVHATATDAAGNVSQQGVGAVDALAPPPPVLAPSNGVTLAGTAEAGATVTLTDGSGNPIGQASVAANGTWSFTPASPLANATAVHATATDAAGNIGAQAIMTVDAVAPLAPVIAPSTGTILAGIAEAGSTVIVTNGSGALIGQTTAAATGSWSVTPASPLAGGTVIHATATDVAGNIGAQATTTIDTTPPALPTGLLVSANGTLLAGAAEAGSTVRIVVNGDAAHPLTVQADGSGHFSLPLTPALVDGQTLSITVTDAAGNVGAAATVYAPELTPPVVTLATAADGYVNAAELAAGLQASVGVTAGMHVGDTLAVTLNGTGGVTLVASHIVTAADQAAGSVAIPVTGTIPDGAATVTATLNGGAPSTAVTFTVDTLAPATPVLSLVNNILSIAADPGTWLTVDAVVAGVHVTEMAVTNGSGLVSMNLLTGLSTNLSWDQLLAAQVSVHATDLAGNDSAIASVGVAAHIVQPPTVGSFVLNAALVPLTLGFSGTATAGDSLGVDIVTPAATVHVTPTLDATGHFSVNVLSASVLTQLGLSATQILNLGSGLSFHVTDTNAQGGASDYSVSLAGSGATLHLGEIALNGTSGDDILTALAGSTEHIVAGTGNDLIQHAGAGDTVDAGAGNDTIQINNTGFAAVNGGTGFDTLLMENGINLTYGAAGTGAISGIERVNLGTNGTLTLTAAAVNTITDGGNVLQITGDATDTLKVSGAVNGGTTQTVNGSVYDVYHLGASTLLVQEHTVHVVVT